MNSKFDVIILGSGIGGLELGIILAKNNLKTLIIDKNQHPRFAVGESTIPQTSQMQTLLSIEFDIPEFNWLGLKSPAAIYENISKNCGLKKVFAFIHHTENNPTNLKYGLQFGNVWRDENHLYRQDIDLFLLNTAEKYGATILQNTSIIEVDIEENSVRVNTSAGIFDAQFIVDGTGHNSLIAKKFNLREEPCRYVHHSRSLFTHMINVKPFEEIFQGGFTNKWSQGTLHHVFERGWIWVIPFNNWDKSENPNVSVGLTYDYRTYPLDSTISPEEEFFKFISKFPSVAEQFKDAKSTIPWARTNRLQYSSKEMAGDRFCLLSHASDFIDPLYSRGMINTTEINKLLARKLITSFKSNTFKKENFIEVENFQRKIVGFADRLANCSYISWSHFPLWNLVVRIWAIGMATLESNLGGHMKMYQVKGFEKHNMIDDYIFSPFEHPQFSKFFVRCERIVLNFEKKLLDPKSAVELLEKEIKDFDFTCVLQNLSNAHVWALKNPHSRDIFLGDEKLTKKWEEKINDDFV